MGEVVCYSKSSSGPAAFMYDFMLHSVRTTICTVDTSITFPVSNYAVRAARNQWLQCTLVSLRTSCTTRAVKSLIRYSSEYTKLSQPTNRQPTAIRYGTSQLWRCIETTLSLQQAIQAGRLVFRCSTPLSGNWYERLLASWLLQLGSGAPSAIGRASPPAPDFAGASNVDDGGPRLR
jgi:hypothetical protein